MKTLAPLLSRARYLAIVLPLFAISTTLHAGCTSGTFYYGTYGPRDTAAYDDAVGSGTCFVYRTGGTGSDGYFGPCSDDGYAYGGSGGSGP